jgi:alkylhydroperoxidase family enzyme
LDEGDDVCRHLEGSNMPVLRGCPHRLLPYVGGRADTLDRLVDDITTLDDAKLRDMILFAVKCSRNPQSLTDDDYDKLRRHGLQQSEIVEIVGMSALAVYANIIADATAMDPDEMFTSI